MARAIWSGSIAFGLVNVPVKLFNATSPQDVRFHQFERGTARRVHYRRVAGEALEPDSSPLPPPREAPHPPAGGEDGALSAASAHLPRREGPPDDARAPEPEVAYEDLVKGYEVDRDSFVLIDPDELRALRPEQTQTIEIEEFVDLSGIDPVYFEKSYYVSPKRGVGAEKPYALLQQAMERAGRVGIARFVLRTKEYLAAVRPSRGILVLETLFYADEVRPVGEIDNLPSGVPVSERELDVAEQLISLLATEWDPGRYRDRYRERVRELIESKGVTRAAREEEVEAVSRVPDLMEALRRSVEEAKRSEAERSAAGGPNGERPPARDTRAG